MEEALREKPFKLTHINPEADDFASALGISRKRREEIGNQSSKIFNDYLAANTEAKTKSDFDCFLEILNKVPNNLEELVFCSFSYGHNLARFQSMEKTLSDLLKKLGDSGLASNDNDE